MTDDDGAAASGRCRWDTDDDGRQRHHDHVWAERERAELLDIGPRLREVFGPVGLGRGGDDTNANLQNSPLVQKGFQLGFLFQLFHSYSPSESVIASVTVFDPLQLNACHRHACTHKAGQHRGQRATLCARPASRGRGSGDWECSGQYCSVTVCACSRSDCPSVRTLAHTCGYCAGLAQRGEGVA